jgi:transcriptional regulator with GAF, ATPase, and Fis domain
VVGHRYLLICRTPEELARISGKPASGDPWYPVGNPSRRSASLLFVPLWCGEDFKGVLSVQSYRMNAYRHADAERVALVAEYVGLTLRNARLAEEAARSRR